MSEVKNLVKRKGESTDKNGTKKKTKTEEESQPSEEVEGDEKRWDTLEHHGVLFPPFYKQHNVRPLRLKVPMELNSFQEEIATYWSQSLGTDWESNQRYRTNFEELFLKSFPKSAGKIKFEDIDFTPIVDHLQKEKEKRKEKTPEEKERLKKEKQVRDNFYGFALMDSSIEKVNGYQIEPPSLFKGRGDHPKAGKLKPRLMPENITINCSEDAPVPKCEVPGHAWGQIIHNKNIMWLASFGKQSELGTKKPKYIWLAPSSKLKGENDKKKYEKARKLKTLIENIREDYNAKMASKDVRNKQLGTALYLIDKLALRVGNEKSEEEADTVGCCSLRVEHITCNPDQTISLDFLGKDSVRYQNTVTVDELPWKCLNSFSMNKSKQSNLFDEIDVFSNQLTL